MPIPIFKTTSQIISQGLRLLFKPFLLRYLFWLLLIFAITIYAVRLTFNDQGNPFTFTNVTMLLISSLALIIYALAFQPVIIRYLVTDQTPKFVFGLMPALLSKDFKYWLYVLYTNFRALFKPILILIPSALVMLVMKSSINFFINNEDISQNFLAISFTIVVVICCIIWLIDSFKLQLTPTYLVSYHNSYNINEVANTSIKVMKNNVLRTWCIFFLVSALCKILTILFIVIVGIYAEKNPSILSIIFIALGSYDYMILFVSYPSLVYRHFKSQFEISLIDIKPNEITSQLATNKYDQ